MVERRDDLTLGAESRMIHVRVEPGAQQFERDVLLELPVGATREQHARHASAPDLAHDRVGADSSAGRRPSRFLGFSDDRRGDVRGRRRKESARVVHPLQELLRFAAQVWGADARGVEHFRPIARIARERRIEHLGEALPPIRIDVRCHERPTDTSSDEAPAAAHGSNVQRPDRHGKAARSGR